MDEVHVGQDLGGRDAVVEAEAIVRYRAGTASPDAPDDPAPALLFHSEVYRRLDWYLPNLVGNLHARQEWEFFAPVMVGDTVQTRSLITDRYAKRGRDYVVNEVLFVNDTGALISRGRTHQSFLRETANEGIVVDKTREKSAERRFDVDTSAAIEEIPALRKEISLDMCWKFSGPARTYHNDRDAAIKLGFPDIVVQGMMSVCFLSEMMTDRFGAGWVAGGKMAVNLVNIVWQSDAVTCRGFVREVTPEGERERAHLDIWCEKDDGTKVTIGTASAAVT